MTCAMYLAYSLTQVLRKSEVRILRLFAEYWGIQFFGDAEANDDIHGIVLELFGTKSNTEARMDVE
jgi:hypothetical protein